MNRNGVGKVGHRSSGQVQEDAFISFAALIVVIIAVVAACCL